jgi:hypothetical protein
VIDLNDNEGGVIGGLVFVGGIAVLIFFIVRRKKNRHSKTVTVVPNEPKTETLTEVISRTTKDTKRQQIRTQRNQIQSQRKTMTKTTMDSDSIPMTVISG